MTSEALTREEALKYLQTGHTIWVVKQAQEVCEALGVPFKKELVWTWESPEDAFQRYGFYSSEEGPSEGVWSLKLARHVAFELGVTDYQSYHGRGSQARAIAEAIEKHFQKGGTLP